MQSEIEYVVGIVHYRDPGSVIALVNAISLWTKRPSEILIADNSGDIDLRDWSHHPSFVNVRVLPMGGNLGYGPAANRLLQESARAQIPYLLLLTQDSVLRNDTAEHLVVYMAHERLCAVAAPILFLASKPETLFSSGGIITKYGRTLHPNQGRNVDSHMIQDEPYSVDWVDGACTLLRVDDCLKIGGFDPAYFLYVEEVDLQLRLRNAGMNVVVVPRAFAQQEPGNYTLYFKYRNLTYFTRKNADTLRGWPWLFALPKDSLRRLREGRPDEVAWALRGLFDSWSGRMGPRPASLTALNPELPRA
ncbi:N-acetylglucosaminyl-diphospho-decaprenol L-rhamnosyltransferase [Pseudarthrobacter sp. PvP090]